MTHFFAFILGAQLLTGFFAMLRLAWKSPCSSFRFATERLRAAARRSPENGFEIGAGHAEPGRPESERSDVAVRRALPIR